MATSLTLRARQVQVYRFSQAADLLRLSTRELEEHLANVAQDNPMLVLRARQSVGAQGGDWLETLTIADERSLTDHCFHVLSGLISQGGMVERLIVTFIEELEPSGWLGTSVDAVAERLSISRDLVETALKLVQRRIEPAGLFARNLAECLRLQLEDKDALTDKLSRVLTHLDHLESGGSQALAKVCGLSIEDVDACLASLRHLNPKPGGLFQSDPSLLREPDVVVTRGDAGLEVRFTNPSLADFDLWKVSSTQNNADIAEARDTARSLRDALRLRQLAIKNVVDVLVARQRRFFDKGDAALEPLTMTDVAEKAGFHPSTVSRVLNGLLIEGPHGIIAGKALCPGASAERSGHSKPQVQNRIKTLIRTEAPHAPLSDSDVTEMLKKEGILVSRRAVAKYRQELGFPTANRRRVVS